MSNANEMEQIDIEQALEEVGAQQFDDRWCCQMCRTAEAICDFHQSMEQDGYKPPQSFHF